MKSIVRSKDAGVFYGEVIAKDNLGNITMKDVRKIFYWEGAAAIQQIAMEGLKKTESSKLTMIIPEQEIGGAIEIIPCTAAAEKNLDGIKVWKI